MVNRGAALPRAGQVKSSKLMAAQRPLAVSPLSIGTRALAHTGEPLGFVMAVGLRRGAQRAQDAAGFQQRGAKPRGELAKRFAITDGARLGHAIEIGRGQARGVHGEGDRRRHLELSDLLTAITGDKLEGRLHVRPPPLGFFEACYAARAASFVLRNGANLLDVLWNISSQELAVVRRPPRSRSTKG